MELFIMKYWVQLSAVVTYTVWLVRMESKVKNNEKEIEELKTNMKEENAKINTKLDVLCDSVTKMGNSLSELTGYLKGCKDKDM